FFFSSRRRHTRSYGDWSSDVCSSDLDGMLAFDLQQAFVLRRRQDRLDGRVAVLDDLHGLGARCRGGQTHVLEDVACLGVLFNKRSEERRVGKEFRSVWWGE